MRLLLLLLAAICTILLWLISLAWMMALLLPFPVLIGGFIYFIIRNQNRRAVLRTTTVQNIKKDLAKPNVGQANKDFCKAFSWWI